MAIKSIAIAAALAFGVAGPAAAADYNFQYLMNTGELVTGSFSGTAQGNLVVDLTNVSVLVDGNPFAGQIFVYGFTGYNGPGGPNVSTPDQFVLNAAQVSTDPLLNNFLFRNVPAGMPVSEQFYIFPWSNGPGNQVATQLHIGGSATEFFNGNYIPSNWSLTEVNAPESAVPEPATWLMLLSGFGLVGVMARRRQVTVAA